MQLSVSWSNPERRVRQLFAEAVTQLGNRRPELSISCFRLELDEDLFSQNWIISLGYFEFLAMGAGSLLWLERGKVVAVVATPCGSCVEELVDMTVQLW